jgi:hypothetical protein
MEAMVGVFDSAFLYHGLTAYSQRDGLELGKHRITVILDGVMTLHSTAPCAGVHRRTPSASWPDSER